MDFFNPWTTGISQLLGGFTRQLTLLKRPSRPFVRITTAIGEKHLSRFVGTAHNRPFFWCEIPVAVQVLKAAHLYITVFKH